MINTSIAFRKALQEDREFRVKDRIILKNKKEVPISLNDLMEYRINEATSTSGKFEIGAAVIKEYDITLDDSDEQYDGYDFEDADIEAVIGLRLENDTWEDLKKGSYRVHKATFGESTLQIRAYDAMLFLDRPYSDSSLSYPATIQQIIADASRTCQVAYDASTIEMGNYRVDAKPEENLTFRDVISYCAQIMGCYARINHLGRLAFGWYDFSIGLSGGMDGGVFDTVSTSQYVSGDSFDGGTFDDYSDGEDYDSGVFSDTDAYHHFYDLYSSSVNGSDVNVTGVQITIKQDNSEEKYLYGTDSYALEIKDNPLIRTGTLAQIAKHIGAKIINKPFRPLNISVQSNPAIEAGDSAVVTPRKLTAYTTVITDTTFNLGGAQTVASTAETPTEKIFTRYSAATKILDAAKKEMNISMSDYDLAVQQMNQLAANTLGFYQTAVKQEDGSLIVYRHDKPKLAESKIVYKSGIDGFFVTQNYTGKDSTTAWKNGFDSSGNAALNILSVIGIHWDWASGGTLTLGGKGNGNGLLQLLNSGGTKIMELSNGGQILYDTDGLASAVLQYDRLFFFEDAKNITGSEQNVTGICLWKKGIAEFEGTIYKDDNNNIIFDPELIPIEDEDAGEEVYEPLSFSDGLTGIFKRIKADKIEGNIYDSSFYGGNTFNDTNEFKAVQKFRNSLLVYNPGTTTAGWTACIDQGNYKLTTKSSSSVRYKDVGQPISEQDIAGWYNIRPVWAKYKEGYLSENDEREGTEFPMFIAEDVEKYMPLAVDHLPDGRAETWNERIMIPAMFAMLKSQKQEIEDLKKLIQGGRDGNTDKKRTV